MKKDNSRKMVQEDRDILRRDLVRRLEAMPYCKIDIVGYLKWNEDFKKKFEDYKKVKEDALEKIDRPYILYSYDATDRFGFLDAPESWDSYGVPTDFIKPYLIPLESLTSENRIEMGFAIQKDKISPYGEIKPSGVDNLLLSSVRQCDNFMRWLVINHYDYLGLIEKDLALPAKEGMYKHQPFI